MTAKAALLAAIAAGLLRAQGPGNVLLVVNESSAISRSVGEYYALRRHIPLKNICHLNVSAAEDIARLDYNRRIAAPIEACLRANQLTETVLYIVTTSGVPLRISGRENEIAAVDSELTLLYADLRQPPHRVAGVLHNPFFGRMNAAFRHPDFPIYLVTRLAGYDFPDVKGLIDRALVAKNRGKFVIDLKSSDDAPGNDWLRNAALKLPKERVVFDESTRVLYDESDVIGYAAWGSNDPNRKRRWLGFKWLPGAIMTEYVSTNARTFSRPPAAWTIGTWKDTKTWFAGAPQTMTADYVHEGATGASGHVSEPYLAQTPRPDYLLPAYYAGRNLAESYYLAIPSLSWMNVVIGDPLCAIGKP